MPIYFMILKALSKSRLVLDSILMKLLRRECESIALVRVLFVFFTITGTAEASEHWVGEGG